MARQLAEWGDTARERRARARRRAARPVERDLEAVLVDLADDFPLLASLVERRAGGQRRLPMAGRGRGPASWHPAPSWSRHRSWAARTRPCRRLREPAAEWRGGDGDAAGGRAAGASGLRAPRRPRRGCPEAAARSARPGRYGLAIQFEERPDDPELARLVESTVWVNEAHPAYRRAAASRAEGYHIALASALALALPRRRAGEGARLRHRLPRALGRGPRPPQAREAAVGTPKLEEEILMCRSIKTLHNFAPPATDDEIRASSLQFVRKLSGFTRPSKANEVAFARAVDQVAHAARELLDALVTKSLRAIATMKPRKRVPERRLALLE